MEVRYMGGSKPDKAFEQTNYGIHKTVLLEYYIADGAFRYSSWRNPQLCLRDQIGSTKARWVSCRWWSTTGSRCLNTAGLSLCTAMGIRKVLSYIRHLEQGKRHYRDPNSMQTVRKRVPHSTLRFGRVVVNFLFGKQST